MDGISLNRPLGRQAVCVPHLLIFISFLLDFIFSVLLVLSFLACGACTQTLQWLSGMQMV